MKKVLFGGIFLLLVLVTVLPVSSQRDDCNGSIRCTFIKAKVNLNKSTCDSLNTSAKAACKNNVADLVVIKNNKFKGNVAQKYGWLNYLVVFFIIIAGGYLYHKFTKR